MNPIKDLVSIITSVSNNASTLSSTIDSILAQSYPTWELILVNDASTDQSSALIKAAMAKDKRIKGIDLYSPVGSAKARNVALDSARGQYIAFLNADEAWDTTKLDKQLKFMKDNVAPFTYTAYRTHKGRIFKALPSVDEKSLLIYNPIGTLSVIIDRRETGDFILPDQQKGQDLLTWLMIMKRGYPAMGLNEVLATGPDEQPDATSNKAWPALNHQWATYRQVLGFSKLKSSLMLLHYLKLTVKK